jgi:hypothetical protein
VHRISTGELIYQTTEVTPGSSVNVTSESISDENNGISRPVGSPCDHWKFLDDVNFIQNGDVQRSIGDQLYTVNSVSAKQVPILYVGDAYSSPVVHAETNVNNLIQEVFTDLSGQMQPGLLSLATIAEVGSLKNLAKSFFSIYHNVKHTFTAGTTLGKLKAAAKADLGYQFGIRPLVGDVIAAINVAKAIESHMKKLSRRNAMSSFVVQKRSAPTPTGNDWIGTTTTTVSARCAASYDISDTNVTLNILGYFGFTNIGSVAWELVPFSFVVDWFYNIGDAIERLERDAVTGTFNRNYTRILGMNVSHKSEAIRYGIPLVVGPATYFSDWSLGEFSLKCQRYTRGGVDWTSSSILNSLELTGCSATQMLRGAEVVIQKV